MKVYEVELINKEEDGTITYSNSWDKESIWTSSKKEAIALKNEYLKDYNSAKEWDAIIINIVVFPDDAEIKIFDSRLIVDDDVEWISNDCLCEIDLKETGEE